MYGIYNPKRLAILTQLRVGLSELNYHKFRHNFNIAINPLCPINDGVEDTEHFLLHCHSYHQQRNSLLSRVQSVLLSCGLSDLSNVEFVSILLYGDERLHFESNKISIKATLDFIESSKRFSYSNLRNFLSSFQTFIIFHYYLLLGTCNHCQRSLEYSPDNAVYIDMVHL